MGHVTYSEVVREIIMDPRFVFEDEMLQRRLSILNWCLFHILQAIREFAKAEIKKTPLIDKAQAGELFTRFFNYVRNAPSAVEFDKREADMRCLLGEEHLLSAVGKLYNRNLVACSEGKLLVFPDSANVEAALRLDLPGGVYHSNLDSLTDGMANPMYLPRAVDYYDRQWRPNWCYWAECVVGGRQHRTDAASEITINQMKHELYGKSDGGGCGTQRVDTFVHKDRTHTKNNCVRVLDEEGKKIATGGVKVSAAIDQRKPKAFRLVAKDSEYFKGGAL